MKRLLFISLSLILTLPFCYAQATDDEKYEQANQYFKAKEYDKAIPLLNELATRNHAKAINHLGLCYGNGWGVVKDLNKSVDYYQKASDLGLRRAQCNLGFCYEHGEGVAVNKEKAYFWYDKSFRQYKKLADRGDADAQLEVGIFYYYGRMRGGKDYVKSIPWFKKSANQGNAAAYNFLGIIYRHGYGVEKDVDKAYEYFLLGAEKGNAYAMMNMGCLYWAGESVEQNLDKAYDCFIRALDLDSNMVEPKIKIADLYHYDNYQQEKHDKDNYYCEKQAEKWYRLAVMKGNPYAMYKLGCFYDSFFYDGSYGGDFRDDSELWFKRSAEAGYGDAQAMMAMIELEAKSPDYNVALDWIRKAQEKGANDMVYSRNGRKNKSLSKMELCCYFQLKNTSFKSIDSPKSILNSNDYIIIIEKEGKMGALLINNKGEIKSTIIPTIYQAMYYKKPDDFDDDDIITPYEQFEFYVTDKNENHYSIDIKGRKIE